jgi:KDO2-lipid IV(A) lauroyltransferase
MTAAARALAAAALERGLWHPLRLLPTARVSAAGAWLGRRLGPVLHPELDARARANLARLRPDLDPAAALAEVWGNIGATYAEMARGLRLWDEGRVEVRGAAHVLETRRERSVLVAGLHTANPEVLGLTLARLGARPAGIAMRQPTAFRERVITALRRRAGGRVIPARRDAARAALGVLAAGEETLLLYVDESVGGEVRAPSLGRGERRAGNIVLAARLARLTGCAIVPGFVTRLPGPRFVTTFLPPLALPPPSGERAADIAAGVAALDAALDPVVRARLTQWLYTISLRPEEG